jgi:tetratricopeptide (TPR) repeat protein
MGAKPRLTTAKIVKAAPEFPRGDCVPEVALNSRPRGRTFVAGAMLASVLTAAAVVSYFGYDQYRVLRLTRIVRQLFTARRYSAAHEPLARWIALRPRSGEAYYYKAWEALALSQPREAVLAVDEARELGFDRERLDCLAAIYQARAERFNQAEPTLVQAFHAHAEPQEMVAKELARISLATYRFDQAAQAIERWRAFAPEDPQSYLWSNEIASRSEVEPAVLIQNYRAALDRDPTLENARLGLAQELSKARRFDEAQEEFEAYLKKHPTDAAALLGLGRNAFQQGDIKKSGQYFESCLAANPRDPETLKELSQIDLRLGRPRQATERLALLTQIQPFDHEIRYSYAQALNLSGDEAKARVELSHAARLRQEHDQLVRLRYRLVQHPDDLDVRFQVAKWMLEHGHEDEGLKWTKEIFRADPRHVLTHSVLAAYYQKRNQSGLANYHRLMASSGRESGVSINPQSQTP